GCGLVHVVFFFFQAEDGIRDFHVTGVQTCALPIFVVIRSAGETGQLYGSVSTRDIADLLAAEGFDVNRNQVELNNPIKTIGLSEIGRASCRERAWTSGRAGSARGGGAGAVDHAGAR